jgi:hypothetical protein
MRKPAERLAFLFIPRREMGRVGQHKHSALGIRQTSPRTNGESYPQLYPLVYKPGDKYFSVNAGLSREYALNFTYWKFQYLRGVKMTTIVICRECNRFFNLAWTDDANEFNNGHDCEVK